MAGPTNEDIADWMTSGLSEPPDDQRETRHTYVVNPDGSKHHVVACEGCEFDRALPTAKPAQRECQHERFDFDASRFGCVDCNQSMRAIIADLRAENSRLTELFDDRYTTVEIDRMRDQLAATNERIRLLTYRSADIQASLSLLSTRGQRMEFLMQQIAAANEARERAERAIRELLDSRCGRKGDPK